MHSESTGNSIKIYNSKFKDINVLYNKPFLSLNKASLEYDIMQKKVIYI